MPTTLDHIEGLTLSDDAVKRHTNELNSLRYLAQGLNFLALQVGGIEMEVQQRIPRDKIVVGYGNVPWLKGVPMGLVACSFHWYAMSACNYARLVGWLALGQEPRKASGYVTRTIPSVFTWRNKVAAHFARTDPHKNDSPADLASSTMFPLGFDDGLFVTQPLVYSQSGSTAKLPKWSLTRIHNELTGRYWQRP